MASIKRLKKDIDYLTFAIVVDSYNCLIHGKGDNDINEIVQHVMTSGDALRQRVNAGRKVVKSERRAYYKTIRKDLMISVDGAFSKLSDLVKKN